MNKFLVMLLSILCSFQAMADGLVSTGGQGAASDSLLHFNEQTGTVTYIGTPYYGDVQLPDLQLPDNMGMAGLDFDLDGRLLAVTGDETNLLVEIDPQTGELLDIIGEYQAPDIRDIAIHPGTGMIYATSYSSEFYVLDPLNANTVAIVPPASINGPLAFASNGTLYMAEMNPQESSALYTINTSTGERTWVADLNRYYMGLGMGPDGMLYASVFEGNGQWGPASQSFGDIYQINPATGAETLASQNSGMIIHDIAFGDATFAPVIQEPVPSLRIWAMMILGLGLLLLAMRRFQVQ